MLAPSPDDQLEAFFQSLERLGVSRFDVACAYSDHLPDEGPKIIELTYVPTSLTRWYDVARPHWSDLAD